MELLPNPAFTAARANLEWLHLAPSAPFPPVEGSWNHLLWDLVTRSGGSQAILGPSRLLTAPISDIDLPFVVDGPSSTTQRITDRARSTARRLNVGAMGRTPSPIIEALPRLGLGPRCRFMVWEKVHLLPELRRRFPDAEIGFAQRAFPVPDPFVVNPYKAADLLVFQTVGQLEAVLRSEGGIDAVARVVPNGVETDRFCPPTSEDKAAARRELGIPEDAGRVVLFASTLKAKKGTEVVRRLADWAASRTGVHILVAKGTRTMAGRELAHAQRFLSAVRDNPATTCLEGVDRSSMHLLYQASDLTIMPNLYLEGFSMVMLESLSCGVPVAAPRIPTFDELLDDGLTGFMFPPDDMFGHLVRILEETDERRLAEMGARARQVVLDSYPRQVAFDGFTEAMAALA